MDPSVAFLAFLASLRTRPAGGCRSCFVPRVGRRARGAVATVAMHSPGAGDPHDRGVANGVVSCELAKIAKAGVSEMRGFCARPAPRPPPSGRTLALELGVLLAVLVLAATLSPTAPPR